MVMDAYLRQCRVGLFFVLFAAAVPLSIFALSLRAGADQQIILHADMIINEDILGPSASGLVDEQTTSGDPGNGVGQRPTSPFFSGWGNWQYPMHYFIDLGTVRKITRVFLYNETGGGQIVLSTGQPFEWKDTPATMTGYRSWNQFPVNTPTRYLRLTLLNPINLPEMLVYGDGAAVPTPRTNTILRKAPVYIRPTMDQFIGTNAFIDDPIDKLTASVGYVREYHNWSWDTEAPDHLVRFQPSGAAGGGAWFFDDFYGKLKAGGVTVAPSIEGNATVLFPGSKGGDKPLATGADPEAPASYIVHAKHLFQYAARYGSTAVPQSELAIAPDQPQKSGLGLLQYIENWNEPDATWVGRTGYFSPYELAAMCSADYDGDQGRLGNNVGVHNADPKMQLVLGGLSRDRLDYLQSMKLWADYHRGGDFPADVINFHHYSSDAGDDGGFKTTGISPEADKMREKFTNIVTWCHANIPGRQVWVTEFGYDTNPASPVHAPAIAPYTAEEVQGIWLLRSYLALAAAGVDRASMYMFRDTGPATDGGVFATSGMVTQKGEWTPKPSYYYIATLKHRLAGFKFDSDVTPLTLSSKNILAYRFSGPAGATAEVIWCSTSAGTSVDNVPIPVRTGAKTTLVDFTDDSLNGTAAPVTSQNGFVTISVHEKPLIIICN